MTTNDSILVPAHIQGISLSPGEIDLPVVSLKEPRSIIAKLIALAVFNTGYRAPENKDFQFIVAGLLDILKSHYPEMRVSELADALYRGSIGDFGFEIYGINLLTIHKWVKEKSIELKILQHTEAEIIKEQNRRANIERISEIKEAYDAILPIAREGLTRGKKGYPYILAKQLKKLLYLLNDMEPLLPELVFMIKTYAERKAAEPEPRTFLTEIREKKVLSESLVSKIYEYINSFKTDNYSNNSDINN